MSLFAPHHVLPTDGTDGEKNIDMSKFRHFIQGKVRAFDVDRQNIVNSSNYMNWLQTGRIEYMRHIGLPIDRQTFITRHNFMVVHLKVDFTSVLQFDDEYQVLTRTTFMQESSFGMEQVIVSESGTIVLVANVVLVHINPATYRPQPLPTAFRTLVENFEKAE